MKKIYKTMLLFTVGFMAYITLEVCWRGYSYPLMGLCGGIAFVLIDEINNKISWDIDILLQGVIGSIVITIFELIIGEISLRTELLPIMWNYSNAPLNFDGVVCVPFSLIWIGLSVLGILTSDAINYYVLNIQPCPYYKCFGKVILRFKER